MQQLPWFALGLAEESLLQRRGMEIVMGCVLEGGLGGA